MYTNATQSNYWHELFSVMMQWWKKLKFSNVFCDSYTMGCPPVRGDNPRALAS